MHRPKEHRGQTSTNQENAADKRLCANYSGSCGRKWSRLRFTRHFQDLTTSMESCPRGEDNVSQHSQLGFLAGRRNRSLVLDQKSLDVPRKSLLQEKTTPKDIVTSALVAFGAAESRRRRRKPSEIPKIDDAIYRSHTIEYRTSPVLKLWSDVAAAVQLLIRGYAPGSHLRSA